MYELEYADTTDHEKYRTYFSKYPFIDYIYRLNISKSKHITSQIDDITEAKSATNVDDNSGIKKMTISILRQITMRKVRQIIIQTPSQTLKQISIQTL